MNQYVFIIFWILFLGILVNSPSMRVYKYHENGDVDIRVSWKYMILIVIPISICCAVRGNFADSMAYRYYFEHFSKSISDLIVYMFTGNKGPGYAFVQFIGRYLFGTNSTIFLGFIALIQSVVLVRFYNKYSINIWLSLFVFIASTDYLSWMQNGIRQFLAVTLIIFFSDLLFEKKYLKMVIVILLAATIHTSALIMLPVIFIVQGKAWNKKTVLLIIVTALAVSSLESFSGIVGNLLMDTQYSRSFADWQYSGNDGVNPLRVALYSIPTALSIINIRFIRKDDNEIINVACNMGVVSTVLYIMGMLTSGIYVGRLPIYCSLYSNGILLPWLIKKGFKYDSRKLVKSVMVIGYIVFYYYQSHVIWRLF